MRNRDTRLETADQDRLFRESVQESIRDKTLPPAENAALPAAAAPETAFDQPGEYYPDQGKSGGQNFRKIGNDDFRLTVPTGAYLTRSLHSFTLPARIASEARQSASPRLRDA